MAKKEVKKETKKGPAVPKSRGPYKKKVAPIVTDTVITEPPPVFTEPFPEEETPINAPVVEVHMPEPAPVAAPIVVVAPPIVEVAAPIVEVAPVVVAPAETEKEKNDRILNERREAWLKLNP